MWLAYLVKRVVAGTIGLFLAYVIHQIIRDYLKKREFKRKSPNIPWLSGGSLLGGHVNDILITAGNWKRVGKYHEKYGKTWACQLRNRTMVSTLDLELIKTFIVDEPNDHNLKFDPNLPIKELMEDCVMFTEDIKQWNRIRKAMAPAFSLHKIKSPETIGLIQECLNHMIDAIEYKLNGKECVDLNLDDIFQRYSVDLVLTIFLKQPNRMDYKAETEPWTSAFDKFNEASRHPLLKLMTLFPALMPVFDWVLFHLHPSGEIRKNLYNYVTDHITKNEKVRAESKAKGESDFEKVEKFTMRDGSSFRRGLVDYFMDRYFSGDVTRREFINSTTNLMWAGNKTTNDSLSKVVYNLSNHPEIQDKLRHLVLTEGEESQFIDWCLHESMRYTTPVYSGCTRTISRDIQSEVGLIPAGTLVYTPSFLIHKLKEYWGEDADEFKPDRWANSRSFHPIQYLVFGAGKRYCIGANFSMVNMKMVLGQLIKRYRFEPSTKNDPNNTHDAPSMIVNIYRKPTWAKVYRVK